MSFILDALKKSEAERQRQAGPTLLELRVTQPRRRYPLWALVVGVLLAANVAVLLIFLLNRPPTAPAAVSTPGGLSAASNSVPAAPAGAPVRTTAVPGAQPLAAGAGAGTGTSAVTRVPPLVAPPGDGSAVAPAAAAASGDNEAAGASEQTRNPADYEPALPAGSQPPSPVTVSQAGAADYSNLPSISQIGGSVPAMQLDILVSSDVVSERYALIDMHRVHEGDVLANGARVLAITPSGVAMDYHGQDFMLRPGGTAP